MVSRKKRQESSPGAGELSTGKKRTRTKVAKEEPKKSAKKKTEPKGTKKNAKKEVKEEQKSEMGEEEESLEERMHEAFGAGQTMEDNDNAEASMDAYRSVVELFENEAAKSEVAKEMDLSAPSPPLRLIASVAANSVAGFYIDREEPAPQRVWLKKALSLWPGNLMAKLNLANLEREHGDQSTALALYKEIAQSPSEDVNDDADDWVQLWILTPRQICLDMATYTAALILHQVGEYDAAIPLLQSFDFKYRIAPGVWTAASSRRLVDASAQIKKADLQTSPGVPVQFIKDALEGPLVEALQKSFDPTSPYWKETDYKERGYYSFWYDISLPPSNLVELAIKKMLRMVNRDDIVGAEWWVHSRAPGRNLGHQLHFDTEENTLEIEKEIVHPVVSSVTYLSGGEHGGCTIVFDQGVRDEKPCKKAVVATPSEGGLLLFPGNALHGVLPGDVESKVGAPRRLTLLVGFWNKPVFYTGKRTRLGPCSVFPPATRSCSWPTILDIPPSLQPPPQVRRRKGSAAPKPSEETSQEEGSSEAEDFELIPLQVVSPAWEELPSSGSSKAEGPTLTAPEDIDQRFFIHSFSSFKEHLLPSQESE